MSHVLTSSTSLASVNVAAKNTSPISNRRGSSLSLIAADTSHLARKQIETFIANGFATHYGAALSPSTFLPVLFALEVKGVKAAVGARFGVEDNTPAMLFIEQYLEHPVEVALANKGINVQRQHIVEVGNLFSSSSRYTLPLLLSLFFMLKQCGSEYLVFSATTQLKQLLQGAGIELISLACADASKLAPSANNWGTYYDTAPEVVAISLKSVTHHVTHSASLNSYYQQAIGLISENATALSTNAYLSCLSKETSHVA